MFHTLTRFSSQKILCSSAARLTTRNISQAFVGNLPSSVKIVEVGPRDGLQNEKKFVPTEIKKEFIKLLNASGLRVVEATSFVSPKWVPQMADNGVLFSGMEKLDHISYPVLVPNILGYEAAMKAGVKEIAVFASASETFSHRNINCTIEESLQRFTPVLSQAKKDGTRIRAYVSCAAGCPYEGPVDPVVVADISEKLFKEGCYEISLSDTIGTATPSVIWNMIAETKKRVPIEHLAGHYHDTYGMALTNIVASMQMGMSTFDSSVAGLGGCPYANGAAGNVATEEVVYLLQGMGIQTGVDLDKIIEAGQFISAFLERAVSSKVSQAITSAKDRKLKEDLAQLAAPVTPTKKPNAYSSPPPAPKRSSFSSAAMHCGPSSNPSTLV